MSSGQDQRNAHKQQPKGYRLSLMVVLFVSLYLSYLILFPFVDTLIFAILLSSFLYPLQVFLVKQFRGRKNVAAICIVFLITFAIALPVFFFTSTLVSQGVDTVNNLNDWVKEGNVQKMSGDPRVVHYLAWVQERAPWLTINKTEIANNLIQLSKDAGQFLFSKAATIAGNVAGLITQFFIMLFVAFYLVRDGKEMVEQFRYFSPLRPDQEDRIIGGIRVVAKSVLLGTFLTAMLQGAAGGLALRGLGFPGLFWGTMMGLCSLIPVVGTALIWGPIALYLVIFGEWKSAIFLAAWCIVIMGLIDNLVRPFLMKGKSKMSPFYIFLAIIGGLQYFGLKGILYGPLILTFAMIMLYIYGVEYHDELSDSKKAQPVPFEKDIGA